MTNLFKDIIEGYKGVFLISKPMINEWVILIFKLIILY